MAEEELIKRIHTGIGGLDTMLFGGIPETNQVVFAGGPGSGKSLFCIESLYHYAESGGTSLFVSFDEKPNEIIKNAKSAFPDFAKKMEELVSAKKLNFVNTEIAFDLDGGDDKKLADSFAAVILKIEKMVQDTGAKVVALDSISLFKLIASGRSSYIYRRAVLSLLMGLRNLGITALLTVELRSTERKDVAFSPEFFLFDGIIILYQSESAEKRVFNLEIIKMRGSRHSISFAPYDITSKGIRVFAAVEEAELI